MKRNIYYTSVMALALFAVSCNNDKSTPGYTFMDDMYESPSIETYESAPQFSNGLGAQLPVKGTVPRGYMPYEYVDSPEGYELARTTLKLPEIYLPEAMAEEGKNLYNIFCSSCHGEKGDGNGWLMQQEKILGVPAYSKERLPDITAGSIYHVIMYGKGVMGSHASQLNYDERWKIVRYVLQLRGEEVSTPTGDQSKEQQS